MQYSPQAKHITNRLKLLIPVLGVSDLGCYIPWRATFHKQVSLLVNPSSQTEICNNALEFLFISDQNILRLKIPVYEPFSMHMI